MNRQSPDPTTREGLEIILQIAREAARDAGRLAETGFRRSPVIEHKGAVDLVTSYDRDSETLLRDRLNEALPFPIVGEEQGGAPPAEGPSFYVDPIDGTTNFVHGHPFWCVSIGLVLSGVPVLGVVVAPPLALEWCGWVAASGERRATRQRSGFEPFPGQSSAEECRVSTVDRLEDSLLATGFPYDRQTSPDNNFDAFIAIKRRCQAVRRCGSAALDLCMVAEGTYEGYWERKLRAWDIAGGIALVRAAGGRVTDYDGGGAVVLDKGHVVATNGHIHEALVKELALVEVAQSQPLVGRGA